MRYAPIFIWMAGMAALGYDPDDVLSRATLKVLASVKSVPHYTCVETVSRNYFEPAAVTLPRDCPVLMEQRRHRTLDMYLHLYSRDRLRLDVTMASQGEIFS